MLSPAAALMAALIGGAGLAALLIVALLALHAWCARRRLPMVTHFDIAMIEAELGLESFDCWRWRATGGECCPSGTARLDCPALGPVIKRARRPAR